MTSRWLEKRAAAASIVAGAQLKDGSQRDAVNRLSRLGRVYGVGKNLDRKRIYRPRQGGHTIWKVIFQQDVADRAKRANEGGLRVYDRNYLIPAAWPRGHKGQPERPGSEEKAKRDRRPGARRAKANAAMLKDCSHRARPCGGSGSTWLRHLQEITDALASSTALSSRRTALVKASPSWPSQL